MENNAVTHSPGAWNFDFGSGLSISLLQELLPAMTQEESATRIFYDGYQTASAKDLFLIGGRLYELRDTEGKVGEAVQSARQFIKDGVRKNWLNTQTRIQYQPSGNDNIIHGYGTSCVESKAVDFVGKDGEIQSNLTLEQSLALTGKKPKEVAEIMTYLNETQGYVWRFNNKPQTPTEAVVWLGANSDWFLLYCGRDPQYAMASFGVRLSQKIKRYNKNGTNS